MDKFRTIDPIDTARITVTEVRSQDKSVVSASVLVNARSAIWKKFLYVQSKIMGQKEDEYLFNHSVVVDVYNLENFKYSHSFYLPHVANEPITQLQVYDGYIYTLSNNYINRFQVELPNIKLTH